jgi:hypothetical protein
MLLLSVLLDSDKGNGNDGRKIVDMFCSCDATLRILMRWFCPQGGDTKNYSEDTAVIDLLALHQDQVLASLVIPLPTFLAAYKAANNLLGGIPKPTVEHNLDEEIGRVNGTPRLKANEDAIAIGNAEGNDDDNDNGKDDDEIIDALNAVETAAIGGRAHIGRLILDALTKGTINAIEKFHTQRKENDETKRIKAAFTSPRLNEAAQRIALVIANKPAAEMPVLCGLVQETAAKSTTAMERRIQSLEDQLKAIQGSKSQKNPRATGRRRPPRGSSRRTRTPPLPPRSPSPSPSSPPISAPTAAILQKAKGRRKREDGKVSFDGKKAAKPPKSRK